MGIPHFSTPPAWLWVKTQRYPSQTVPVLSCRWYSWMFMNPQSYPYGSSRTFWKEVFGIYFTLIWKLFCTFSDRVWIHSAIGYGNFIGLWSHPHIITGWWLTYPSEKYEFVSWDYYSHIYIYIYYIYYIYIYIYIYIYGKKKMFQTTNQIIFKTHDRTGETTILQLLFFQRPGFSRLFLNCQLNYLIDSWLFGQCEIMIICLYMFKMDWLINFVVTPSHP